jgi:hypothetical protein
MKARKVLYTRVRILLFRLILYSLHLNFRDYIHDHNNKLSSYTEEGNHFEEKFNQYFKKICYDIERNYIRDYVLFFYFTVVKDLKKHNFLFCACALPLKVSNAF